MKEIEFSIIADTDLDAEPVHRIVADFSKQQNCRVNLSQIQWDDAWSTLLMNALHGEGPHVSQVGSTWGTTLGSMEALRPFSQKDLALMNAPGAFEPVAWQSALRGGGQRVWAIPWTAYTYIICYRRDLISQVGLDETSAFATPQNMFESLTKLRESGVNNPWAFPTQKSYLDLVHITASWIWGSGGEIVDEIGGKSLFASPEAQNGLYDFFNLYQHIPSQLHGFDYDQCVELFSRGDAAVAVIGADDAIALWNDKNTDPHVRQSLGTASLPGVPWVGGDNLVIWKNVLASLESERATVALVTHLTSCDTQLQYAEETFSLPVRQDSMKEFLKNLEPFRETIQQIFKQGRSHTSVKLWSRIEHQFGMILDQISQQVLAKPDGDIEAILHQVLQSSARRMDITLKR